MTIPKRHGARKGSRKRQLYIHIWGPCPLCGRKPMGKKKGITFCLVCDYTSDESLLRQMVRKVLNEKISTGVSKESDSA